MIRLILILLLLPFVMGEEYKSGDIIELYTIEKCQGPVKIKATSENTVKDGELRIEKCTVSSNDIWNCQCQGKFVVRLLTPDDIKNIYDFSIQYYTEYKQVNKTVNGTPSLEEIMRDNYLETKKLTNIKIEPGKPLKRFFKITLETKNTILFTILMFVFIVSIIMFKGKKMVSGGVKNNNNDVMSYKVTKDKDFDKNVVDILNEIK